MSEMTTKINNLKEQLEEYCFEDGDVNYIVFRLRDIRKELVKEDKVFEIQNLTKVLGISKNTFVKLESGTVGADYRTVIKLINLYTMKGYNPMWMLKKENFFVEKMEGDNSLILNKSSVEIAMNKMLTQLHQAMELTQDAMEEFKQDIKS